MQVERLKTDKIAIFDEFMKKYDSWHCVEMCSYLCTTNSWKFNLLSENEGSFKQLPKYGGPPKRIILSYYTDLGKLICNSHFVNLKGLPSSVFTRKYCY